MIRLKKIFLHFKAEMYPSSNKQTVGITVGSIPPVMRNYMILHKEVL